MSITSSCWIWFMVSHHNSKKKSDSILILDVQMKDLLCRRVTVIVICRLWVNRVTGRKGCDQLCERTNIKSLRRGICQSASLGKLQLEWVGGGRGRYSIQAWLGVHHYFKHANTHTCRFENTKTCSASFLAWLFTAWCRLGTRKPVLCRQTENTCGSPLCPHPSEQDDTPS